MKISDLPARIRTPFAKNAGASYIRTIPETTATLGRASYDQGFPPATFLDEGAGGIPPDGRDFNGVLNQLTAWARWQAAGGQNTYNAAFATAIQGYPLNTVLASNSPGILWRSTSNDNVTDPDGGSPADWERINATDDDLLEGTSDTQFVTPRALADAGLQFPPASPTLNPNAWQRFNFDGTIEKGGYQALSSQTEHIEFLAFPTPFPTSCIDIQLTIVGTGNFTGSTVAYELNGSLTTNGCSVQINSQASTFNDAVGFRWRALGY